MHLLAGGKLVAQNLTLGQDEARFDWPWGEKRRLPLTALRGVKLAAITGDWENDFKRALNEEMPSDRFFVFNKGKVIALDGTFLGLKKSRVTFRWRGKQRRLPISKVFGVVLAQAAPTPDRSGMTRVTLADNARLWAKSLRLEAGALDVRASDRLRDTADT